MVTLASLQSKSFDEKGSFASENEVLKGVEGKDISEIVGASNVASKFGGVALSVAEAIGQTALKPEEMLAFRASVSRGLAAVDKLKGIGFDPNSPVAREAFINGANGMEPDEAAKSAVVEASNSTPFDLPNKGGFAKELQTGIQLG